MKLAVSRRTLPNVGTAYAPSGDGPYPAVLLLHGSEGGLAGWSHCTAIMLAAHGFLAVPFNYARGGNAWHAGDIVDVPLDETERAIAQLAQSDLASSGIGIYGTSRGAEHAQLLATLMSEDGSANIPRAIAVHASADIVHRAWRSSWAGEDAAPGDNTTGPGIRRGPSHAASLSDTAWTWRGSTARVQPGTPIAIEAYQGPVLFSHGEADRVWSCSMSNRLAARIAAAGRSPDLHLYPGEGHRLAAEAANHLMAAVIAFFRMHLVHGM